MLGFVMTFIHAKSRLMSPRRAVVFLLPILGLSIISCGGDSGLSSQGSEEEFCAMLQSIESDQVFENAMDDPEATAEAIKLLTELAQAAPTAELEESVEALIPVMEALATLDENDIYALASLSELMSDPDLEAAGETVDTYSKDVCKIPTSDSSETSTEESLAP
jgi:hypothetical protein